MRSYVARWGNSLAVRIPKAFADDLGLADGVSIEIAREGDQIILRRQAPSLVELLEKVTPQNLHDEADWGAPMGTEHW